MMLTILRLVVGIFRNGLGANMPETDTTIYVQQALIDAGYDLDSFGELSTGEQARILESARQLHTDSVPQ